MYRINYEIDSEGYLLSWQQFPFDETKPYVECEMYPELIVGVTMVVGNKFVTDFERRAELMEKLKKINDLKAELSLLLAWFETYDIHVAEYNREIRLGITPSIDIAAIDNEAEICRVRIKEIRELLKELEG